MGWITPLNRWLTPARQNYAFLLGGALWIAWLVSVLSGRGNLDLAGQIVGTDYVQFYAAGQTLLRGESARLYDFAYQKDLETAISGEPFEGVHAFITPPFLAWLFVPFAALPYRLSFALWSLAGLLLLWFSLRGLGARQPGRAFAWALTWFPVFASVSFGQNSLLSLGIVALTYFLWQRQRPLLAGLTLSLALYKPQLALGIGLLWLLNWRRDGRALLGLGLGGAILGGLCFGLLPEASRAYLQLAQTVLPTMLETKGFPLWNAHTLRAFFLLLFPPWPGLASLMAAVLSLGGIAFTVRFWQQRRQNPALAFAGAVCLTIWITPHAMIYDWALFLIPAVILWQHHLKERQRWRVLFAGLWLVTLFSGPLTLGQQRLLPVAVQISLPMLALALYNAYRALTARPTSPIVAASPEQN
jgi:hypothetical protein